MSRRPRVLLLAPYYDRGTPGESWSTWKWVEGVSEACDTTVLTWHRAGWDPAGSPVAAREVVDWTEPDLPGFRGRLAWELKPGYPLFYRKARRWIRDALRRGERFDLAHQINPLALRYPTPVHDLGIKFVVGPLAGSLANPPGFAAAARERRWFRKLRALDGLRLRRDPWLRSSYTRAAAVIGVAPYVREVLAPCPPRRFEIMSETGVEEVAGAPRPAPAAGEPLRLLFVGRLIRTKGVLEAVRAVAEAGREVALRFDVLGSGELLDECRAEAERLGVAERVTFHGRVDRDSVFEWYRRSHVFLFPSFREPSGNVVFEAMSQGLPLIASTVGGPGHVVDDSCGIRVEPADPERYARGLAEAIVALAREPRRVERLSEGALRRVERLALWPNKVAALLEFYDDLLDRRPAPGPATATAASA